MEFSASGQSSQDSRKGDEKGKARGYSGFCKLVGTNLGKSAAHQHPTVDRKGFIDDAISHRWQLEQAYVDLPD